MPIEFTGVSELARAFGRVPVEVRSTLRPAVQQAANLIANQAKSNASWSTRIPGAISTSSRISSKGGAVVRVSSAKAPHARPYEGVTARGNTFRHPVFGNRDNWVTEETRPFFFPALREKKAEAQSVIAAAVKAATRI